MPRQNKRDYVLFRREFLDARIRCSVGNHECFWIAVARSDIIFENINHEEAHSPYEAINFRKNHLQRGRMWISAENWNDTFAKRSGRNVCAHNRDQCVWNSVQDGCRDVYQSRVKGVNRGYVRNPWKDFMRVYKAGETRPFVSSYILAGIPLMTVLIS